MFGLIKTKSNNYQETEVVAAKKNLKDIVTPIEERLTIRYHKDLCIMMAKGRSTSLKVLPVYSKLIENAKNHFNNNDRLTCYLHYSVINATTTKLLFNLFKVLQKACHSGKSVAVYWVVDSGNEELMDIGLDLMAHLDFKFHITQP